MVDTASLLGHHVKMLHNSSMPDDVLIPVLGYPDVGDAVSWLEAAFGFRLRWQVADHRAQVAVGGSAALAIVHADPSTGSGGGRGVDHVMVRVDDAAAHRSTAQSAGAVVGDLEDQPYGERQYTATDPTGRTWVFTESVADIDPTSWGATIS